MGNKSSLFCVSILLMELRGAAFVNHRFIKHLLHYNTRFYKNTIVQRYQPTASYQYVYSIHKQQLGREKKKGGGGGL